MFSSEVHVPVKRHRGEPGHSRDTHGTRGRTKALGPHRRTSQPSKPTNNAHPARQRDDRSHGRLNSRRPGADRSPRPTQKRPPPANPILPPPAPRVPVKRHRGEPGRHTRDRHTNRTNRPPSKPTHPPTRAPDHTQTAPDHTLTQTPGRTRRHKPHLNRTTHPIKRGGGDGDGDGAQTRERERERRQAQGASLTASVAALFRVPGGAEVRASRSPAAEDGAHGSCCPARTGIDDERFKNTEGAGTYTGHTGHTGTRMHTDHTDGRPSPWGHVTQCVCGRDNLLHTGG